MKSLIYRYKGGAKVYANLDYPPSLRGYTCTIKLPPGDYPDRISFESMEEWRARLSDPRYIPTVLEDDDASGIPGGHSEDAEASS